MNVIADKENIPNFTLKSPTPFKGTVKLEKV
jgi:hypothetical protein